MSADQQTFGDLAITKEEWNWVEALIRDVERDVQQDAKRAAFIRNLFQWDLAVKQFRKAEQKHLLLRAPTELDLRCHAVCLHALLAIGHAIALDVKNIKELEQFGVSEGQIAAYVAELEQSLREWHHGFSESEVRKAQEKIFGASA